MRKIALAAIIIAFLAAFGAAVIQKENQLKNGQTVIVKLAPVDPLSLMQGRYMLLDFELSREIEALLHASLPQNSAWPHRGVAVIKLNNDKVARLVRMDNGEALAAGEMLLRYKVIKRRVLFASGAFFFQENLAGLYETARYAELKLDAKGNPLIVNLLNGAFTPIKANMPR